MIMIPMLLKKRMFRDKKKEEEEVLLLLVPPPIFQILPISDSPCHMQQLFIRPQFIHSTCRA